MTFRLILLPLCIGLSAAPLSAQQSSKSKSKDRFREKTEPSHIEVKNVAALNTPGHEHSLAFFQNGIVYGPGADDQLPFQFSFLSPGGQFSAPTPFEIVADFPLLPDAVTFSHDNQTAFFTCLILQHSTTESETRYKIFSAVRAAKGWTELVELPLNGEGFSCRYPSLSADGRTLYFSSDRPGGQGGFDIWKCERGGDGQSWTDPVNLGPLVNTPQNEDYPFISAAGILYFSSTGHRHNQGGYDIFYCEISSPAPAVVSLNSPFNTPFDDFGFILNDDGQQGFFLSNRPGSVGLNDIYSFGLTN